MKRRYMIIATLLMVIVLTLGTTGCNSTDIWGSLNEAQDYIAVVGIKMQSRGWDFPTSPVTWAQYIKDLKDSIQSAKGLGVSATGVTRSLEKDILAIPDPDIDKLNKAFDSNPNW